MYVSLCVSMCVCLRVFVPACIQTNALARQSLCRAVVLAFGAHDGQSNSGAESGVIGGGRVCGHVRVSLSGLLACDSAEWSI